MHMTGASSFVVLLVLMSVSWPSASIRGIPRSVNVLARAGRREGITSNAPTPPRGWYPARPMPPSCSTRVAWLGWIGMAMAESAGNGQRAAGNGLGRLAIVQYDNRYCASDNGRSSRAVVTPEPADGVRRASRVCGVVVDKNASSDGFWWMDAAINGAWAQRQGYAHLLYCVRQCIHPDSREVRSPQWCKVVVIADALAQGYDTVLYMDSDVYWKHPSMNITAGLIAPWAPNWSLSTQRGQGEEDQAKGDGDAPRRASRLLRRAASKSVGAYFGCASPWDSCGVSWNFSAVNANRGSVSTGVILLRNQRNARRMLRDWWHARNGWAQPHHVRRPHSCSDQAVIYRLWSSRPDHALAMNVLAASPGSTGAIKGCMRNAGTRRLQHNSPMEHLTSFYPSYRRKGFAAAWRNVGEAHHDPQWCVRRIDLDASAAAANYFGHVDASRGRSGPWFQQHKDTHKEEGRRLQASRLESSGPDATGGERTDPTATHEAFGKLYSEIIADDERQIGALFGPGSRCQHVYLDVGTNRGVQIRKLFWPSVYPLAHVHRFFDDAFGNRSQRCRVCAVGIEPNARHHRRLDLLTKQVQAAGGRVAILRGAASDADGATTFARANLTRGDKQHDWSASSSSWMRERFRLADSVVVRTIDLARIIRCIQHHLWKRPVESGERRNIWMKLDVEGSELQILPHLMITRTLCAVSFIDIEWHTKFFKQVFATQAQSAANRDARLARKAKRRKMLNRSDIQARPPDSRDGAGVALAASEGVVSLVQRSFPNRRNSFSVAPYLSSGCRTTVIETYDETYSWDPVKKWPKTISCA